MNIALIKNGVVKNVVLWDGVSKWTPDPDFTRVDVSDQPEVTLNWTYDGSNFTAPISDPDGNLIPFEIKLDAIFKGLTPELQASFYPLKSAIKLAIEEQDLVVAKLIIQNQVVPPELEDLKTEMLNLFK